MIGYVLIDSHGAPVVYGYCDGADLEKQARDGLTVHSVSLESGAINPKVKATTVVEDLDGTQWEISPPFVE